MFAPQFLKGKLLTDEIQAQMAAQLGADSLRYLPVESIARAIGKGPDQLCQACITGDYPTPCGQKLAEAAWEDRLSADHRRPYERIAVAKS